MKYNFDKLTSVCTEFGIELSEDYSSTTVTRNTRIKAKCLTRECGEAVDKSFRFLFKIGCYCNKCTYVNGSKKRKASCLEKFGVEHSSQNADVRKKVKLTTVERFGVEYASQNVAVKNKIKATCLVRFGVECSAQNAVVREKMESTCVERFGVKNVFQNADIKEKIKATCLERFGVENAFQNAEIQEKMKATCFKNLGCEFPMQNTKVMKKSKSTCLKKFGVEHAMQNSEVSEKASKSAYKSKDYLFPSGRIERIQGYEHFMLEDLLFIEHVAEADIIVKRSEVPSVWYETADGKRHRYFVDCFIPSQNRCIEAKSAWTFEKKKDVIFLKQKALIDAGLQCEIWVYNAKGEKVDVYV